jgi:UDP-N-acetylmuramate--alanine ligase
MSPGIDLGKNRVRVHIVGIGGAGMSAIAVVLASMGNTVTGSDARSSPVLDRLRARGIEARAGHNPSAVAGADVVVASTAVPADDPEIAEAHARAIPVASRAQMLSSICALRRTIAVAGTHGKTTTSSMLAAILSAAGWSPSFIIGGDIVGLGPGAAWEAGEWMVVEADESDGTFLQIPADAAVITSVEADHLDFYGGWDQLQGAFARFAAGVGGRLVACADDPGASRAAADDPGPNRAPGSPGRSLYGAHPTARWRMVGVTATATATSFELLQSGSSVGKVEVGVPGHHNALNACGAIALALELGVPFPPAAGALSAFRGVKRRFEPRGERNGVTFVDDYAHLPAEVRAAVATARGGGWKRVVTVFQPHRYSRTEALWREFADAFEGSDLVVVTGIYPGDEEPRPGVTGRLVADAIRSAHPDTPVEYAEDRNDLVALVASRLRPGDLCLTLGAGDLTTLPDALLLEVGGACR